MTRFHLAGASALALVFVAAHAHADTDTRAETTAVSQVVVTARPLSTETSDTPTLRKGRASSSDVADLMSRLPGLSAQGAGGFSSLPIIHGLGDDNVAVQVNGAAVDMACPNHMNPPLSYTDPQTLASVRVITGVAPVSDGGDTIGGVIIAETPAPTFAKAGQTLLNGELSSFFRSNGSGAGGAMTATVANDRWSATYAISGARAGDYQGGGAAGRVRSTEYATTNQSLSLATQTGVGLFELQGAFQDAPYEGFPNQYMDLTGNRSWSLNGRYKGVFAWGALEMSADYRQVDHEMNFLDDKGGDAGGGMPMDTRIRSGGYTAKADVVLNRNQTLRVGSEFHHEGLDDFWPPVAGSMMMGPDTYVNVNNGRRDRFGVFAELQSRWGGGVSTVLGVRNDQVWMNTGDVQPYGVNMMNMADDMAAMAFNAADHAHHDSNWSGTAIFRYEPTANVDVELGYGHKSQSPNLYELYAWGRGAMSSQMIGWYGDGNGYVGNLALKPENADTVTATFEVRSDDRAWNLKVEPYYTRVHDFIDARKIADLEDMMGMPSGFVELQFINEDAQFYGVDVTADAPVWRSPTLGTVKASGTLSFVQGDNLTYGGGIYHQPPVNGRIALDHTLGGWDSEIEVVLSAAKDRIDLGRNEPTTAGYALLNLRTAYAWRRWTLNFAIENVTDRNYALPLGGLSLGDYEATGVLRPTPGRGRSFNVGLSRTF